MYRVKDFIDDFFYGVGDKTKVLITVTIVIVFVGLIGYLTL